MVRVFSYFCIFIISNTSLPSPSNATTHIPIQNAISPNYDTTPITPQTWEEMDLTYHCTIKHKRYTNALKLLRPIKWFKQHHMKSIGKIVILSIPNFGIFNVKARITTIKPTQIDTRNINWAKQNNAPVIGIFQHYTANVRTYTFKDNTGHITHINATPNHPFYFINKQTFLPIKDAFSSDQLIGGNNHHNQALHVICNSRTQNHCGTPYTDHPKGSA